MQLGRGLGASRLTERCNKARTSGGLAGRVVASAARALPRLSQQLFVVLRLLSEVVILNALAHALPLQRLRDSTEILWML
jgi:hypothetical protein